MTFVQRLRNFCVYTMETIANAGVDYFIYEPLYVQYFPPERYPSYANAKRNISLVLVNSHISLGNVAPQMPAMIDVSGLQVKKHPDALPADLDDWLNGAAEHGAILFSMGTIAMADEMSAEQVQMFVQAFGGLRQRIIWKWNGVRPPENLSANVHITEWLPQDDVLAHPNLRLFVSHWVWVASMRPSIMAFRYWRCRCLPISHPMQTLLC